MTTRKSKCLPSQRNGPGGGPRLDDQVVGFVVAFPVKERAGIGGHAFQAAPANESADQTATGDNVDHGQFLGQPQGVLVHRQNVAQEHNFALLGPLGHHGADNVDRRHHVQRVAVMLVELHAVKAAFRGVLELVKVHPIELAGPLGTEVLVGEQKVAVSRFLSLVLGISRVPHLGEEIDFFNQNRPPDRRIGQNFC